MFRHGLVALFLTLSGCGSPDADLFTTREPSPRHGLEPFASCRALEENIEARILDSLRQDLRWMLPGMQRQQQQADAPADFTTTNLQTEGVDEGDVVKNDATTIYAIENRDVVVMRSWPPEKLSVIAHVPTPGWPREMLLDGKGRLVVASDFSPETPAAGGIPFRSEGSTVVGLYDVANPARPRLLKEYRMPGYFRGLRRTGPRVQALTDEWLWSGWNWIHDVIGEQKPVRDERLLERRIEELMKKLTPRVRAFTLTQWLGQLATRKGAGPWAEEPLTQDTCRSVLLSRNTHELAFSRVLSLDLDSPDARGLTIVNGRMEGFYASPEALWLTEVKYPWENDREEWTYLHRFDTRQGAKIRYTASGRVAGTAVNSFAFDEYKGHLRVATTISVGEGERRHTVNRVSVLRPEGRELRVVGRTPDFEKGERIFSVRFAGDKGFVVTFRQTDPLLTLDLSKPEAPRLVGELKVPGFSTYLHFVDASHLLTVGQHVPPPLADGSPSPEPSTMKISLFDVSDFAHPREVHSLAMPLGAWSESYWDHHAFTFFPARGVLAIPVASWQPSTDPERPWGEMQSALKVFDVAVERGITPRGELSMSDIETTHRYQGWEWTEQAYVRRSILADDYVYAISSLGVRVSSLQSLSSPLASVIFSSRERD